MIVPQNGYLLCKQIAGTQQVQEGSISFVKEAMPEFEVLATASSAYSVGDHVASSAFGTRIDDNGVKYLIEEKDIIGKTYD